jgi:hypothetical protein
LEAALLAPTPEALWELRPELLEPLRSPDAPFPVKAAPIGRLCQVLLVGHIRGR